MKLEHQGAWPHSPPEPCPDWNSHAALALLPIIPLSWGALPGVKMSGGNTCSLEANEDLRYLNSNFAEAHPVTFSQGQNYSD